MLDWKRTRYIINSIQTKTILTACWKLPVHSFKIVPREKAFGNGFRYHDFDNRKIISLVLLTPSIATHTPLFKKLSRNILQALESKLCSVLTQDFIFSSVEVEERRPLKFGICLSLCAFGGLYFCCTALWGRTDWAPTHKAAPQTLILFQNVLLLERSPTYLFPCYKKERGKEQQSFKVSHSLFVK